MCGLFGSLMARGVFWMSQHVASGHGNAERKPLCHSNSELNGTAGSAILGTAATKSTGNVIRINLGVKIAGTPPASLSLRDKGDTAFERSRATAQAKLDQIVEEARTNRLRGGWSKSSTRSRPASDQVGEAGRVGGGVGEDPAQA